MSEKKESKLGLFDYFDIVSNSKKKLSDEELGAYSPFMINRLVSMCDIYLGIANEINQYQVPKDIHFEFWKAFLPKRKMYNKYIKSKSEGNDHELECLAKYYDIGKKEAKLYFDTLTKEQTKSIVDKYRTR